MLSTEWTGKDPKRGCRRLLLSLRIIVESRVKAEKVIGIAKKYLFG